MTRKMACIGSLSLLAIAAALGCEDDVFPDRPLTGGDAGLLLDANEQRPDASGPLSDAASDAESPPCDASKPFGPKRLVADVSQPDALRETDGRLSPDGKALFFTRNGVISMAARRPDGSFEVGGPIPNVGGGGFPSITRDGSRLYFERSGQIVVSHHLADGGWTDASVVTMTDPPALLAQPYVRPDHELIYFSGPLPGRDVWKAELSGAAAFQAVAPIAELAADASTSDGEDAWEFTPLVTPNGLAIYFASDRGMARGAMRVWMAHRAREADAFGAPVLVTSSSGEPVESVFPDWISSDECTLYVHDDDIYVMERER